MDLLVTTIQQYSALTNRLNRIKKAEKFVWNEEIEQYIKKLKKAFIEGGIQVFPDFRENTMGVLSQVQDEQDRFLACWERKCNKDERSFFNKIFILFLDLIFVQIVAVTVR